MPGLHSPLGLDDSRPGPPSEDPNGGPAWERPGAPLPRWLATAKSLLLRPDTGYLDVPPVSDAAPAVVYGLLGLGAGLIAQTGWVLLAALPPSDVIIEINGTSPAAMRAFGAAVSLLVSGWGAIVGYAILLGVTHIFLWGAARSGVGATARALAYGYGSAAPLLAVPFAGGTLAILAGTVSACFGVAALHRISLGRAIAAVLGAAVVYGLLWLGLIALALATVRV